MFLHNPCISPSSCLRPGIRRSQLGYIHLTPLDFINLAELLLKLPIIFGLIGNPIEAQSRILLCLPGFLLLGLEGISQFGLFDHPLPPELLAFSVLGLPFGQLCLHFFDVLLVGVVNTQVVLLLLF
jgi:hypothetical protein